MKKIKTDSAKAGKKYLIIFVLFIFSFIFKPGNALAASMCISGSCTGISCDMRWQPASDTGWVEYVNRTIDISSVSELSLYSNLAINYYTDDSLNRVLVNGIEILRVQSSIGSHISRAQNKDLTTFSPNPLHIGSNTFICQSARITDQAGGSFCAITLINGTLPTCSLVANPNPISIEDSATLTWNASGAVIATIGKTSDPVASHAAASPAAAGSTVFSPLTTTEYTFTADDGGCNIFKCSATVNVNPPSCTLSADPDGIFLSEKTQLSWTTVGGDSSKPASIAPGIGNVPVKSGVASTGPVTSDTIFTLTFTGLDNIIYTCSKKVEIIKPPVGGLVPCGRLANEPPLSGQPDLIDESKPCDLCSMFYMLKKTINFAIQVSFALAVLMLIFSGLSLAFSAGDTKAIEKAKGAIRYTLIGLAIISASWLIISFILQGMGYSGITTWDQVDCILQR